MKDGQYQFCMKQFKPAIIVIVALAALVVGWTAYREASHRRGGMMGMMGNRALMRTATAPPIRFGAKAPHPDWGACDNCHDVFTGNGNPAAKRGATPAAATMQVATAPPIRPGQKPPHPDWGNCTTCHDIIGATPTPAAAMMRAASVAPPLGGVWLKPITIATADRIGLDNPHGALVSRVQPGSNADTAGLKTGDVIRRVDNKQIETVNEALALIGAKNPNDTLKLVVLRNGREQKIFIKLKDAPQTDIASPAMQPVAAPAPTNRVAVAATEATLEAQVAPDFGGAQAFVIYDPGTGQFFSMQNPGAGTLTAGQQASQQLINQGVGAVIVGNIGPASLARLKGSGVRVYSGAFGPVRTAVNQYLSGNLAAAGGTVVPGGAGNAAGAMAGAGKIAVASAGNSLNSPVANDLGAAPFLIIYDTGTGKAEAVAKNPAADQGTASQQTAQLLVDEGASGVIAGNISADSVRALSQLGVFAFAGVQGSAAQAIQMYRSGRLQATTA